MSQKIFLLVLFILLFTVGLKGQQDLSNAVKSDSIVPKRGNAAIKIGLGFTANHYQGDLSSKKYRANRFYPGVHFSIQPEGRKRLNFVANIGSASITEQTDAPQFASNLPSNVIPNNYIHAQFIYGDIGLRYRFLKKHKTQFYIQPSAGFLFFTPEDKREVGLLDQDLSRLEGESYALIMFQAPLSIGIERKLSPFFSMSMSYTYRFLASDYLDNIGKTGAAKGTDRIHVAQLALHYVPNPSPSQIDIFIPPFDSSLILTDTLLALRSLGIPKDSLNKWLKILPKPRKEEPNYSSILDEGSKWLYEIGKGLVRPESGTPSSPKKEDLIDEGDYDDYSWMWRQLEEKAMLDNEYFLYECPEGETYYSLYERFRIRGSILRQLNNLSESSTPPSDRPIWIPDVTTWLDMFPDVERIIKESGVKDLR